MKNDATNSLVDLASFDALPVLSRIGGQCFCERCGYDLTGAGVRREPVTGVLMTRCSECGHVQSPIWRVSRWGVRVRRQATGLVRLLLTAAVLAVIGEWAIQALMLWAAVQVVIEFVLHPSWFVIGYPILLLIISILSLSLTYVFTVWLGAISGGAGRAFRWVLVMSRPLLLFMLAWGTMRNEQVPALDTVIVVGVLMYGSASVAGLVTSRVLGRALVRAMLPPGMRMSMAYLWTAVGQVPPALPGRVRGMPLDHIT